METLLALKKEVIYNYTSLASMNNLCDLLVNARVGGHGDEYTLPEYWEPPALRDDIGGVLESLICPDANSDILKTIDYLTSCHDTVPRKIALVLEGMNSTVTHMQRKQLRDYVGKVQAYYIQVRKLCGI